MQRNLISINDLSAGEVLDVFAQTEDFQQNATEQAQINPAEIGSLLFFEASTRTRLGFEVAAWRLGVNTVALTETKNTEAMSASESVEDTVRTLDPYSTFFGVRHPDSDVFDKVLPYTDKPVINCGNGHDEHPTQALIDAYTIWQKFGRLDELSVSFIGQLRYSRAAHSLLLLLSKFSGLSIQEFSPTELKVQDEYRPESGSGNSFASSEVPDLGSEDVLYSTGFPPKNPSGVFSQEVRDRYKITAAEAAKLKKDAIILNPLPRIDEISSEVDASPQAHYFKQNELGLFVRMAVIQSYCRS